MFIQESSWIIWKNVIWLTQMTNLFASKIRKLFVFPGTLWMSRACPRCVLKKGLMKGWHPRTSSALMNGGVRNKSPAVEEQSDSSVQWCHHYWVWNRFRLEQPSMSQMLSLVSLHALGWMACTQSRSKLDLEALDYTCIGYSEAVVITGHRDIRKHAEKYVSSRFTCAVSCDLLVLFHMNYKWSVCLFQVHLLHSLRVLHETWPSDISSSSTCGFMLWIMKYYKIQQKWRSHRRWIWRIISLGQF